jgi:hypothetical protein
LLSNLTHFYTKSRLGVGPASREGWGDGGRKKGEDKQPNILFSVVRNNEVTSEDSSSERLPVKRGIIKSVACAAFWSA